MVDTFRPLELGEGGRAADDGRYAWSWSGGRRELDLVSEFPPCSRGLFDDAALFPPGNAAMPDAVAGHAGYRQAWYAGLVGRFVCPAGRLAELDRRARPRPEPVARRSR